jgi:hypothetical protein
VPIPAFSRTSWGRGDKGNLHDRPNLSHFVVPDTTKPGCGIGEVV